MSFRLVPAGATITRVYLAVPEHHGIGAEFDNTDDGWDTAVDYVQTKRRDLIEKLTESLGEFGTPEYVASTADVQCRIDVRWKIDYPGGGGVDMVVERIENVSRLRKATR